MEKGVYNYYSRKYKEELFSDTVMIEIPIMDACQSLDDFINEKKKEGSQVTEYPLLGQIYLIKAINK